MNPLVEHILQNPDDDTPRLVYSDWLEEHGQGPRAELIRVQVERAQLPTWDREQVPLQVRESALLLKHAERWKAELPTLEGVAWGEFRRGFVATATFASFEVLGVNARACWEATPLEAASIRWPRGKDKIDRLKPMGGLRELTLTGPVWGELDVAHVAGASILSTLRTLNVSQCELSGEGFQFLLASPHFAQLTALRAPLNAIGRAAVTALTESVSLKALAELDLSETGSYGRAQRHGRYHEDPIMEAADVAALSRWPGMAHLRSLTLSGNNIGKRGLRALLKSKHTTGLKSLTLRANGLVDQDMKEFNEARPELQLDVLDLGENVLGDVGASDLALAPCLKEVKVLNLDRCEMRLSAAKWLTSSPIIDSVRRLNVNSNSFGPEGIYRLLAKKPPHLHTLQIADNDLEHEGGCHLAESAGSVNLRHVDLSHNRLSDQTTRELAKSRRLRDLLVLRLGGNSLSKSAAENLRNSPLGKQLMVLELPGGEQK